jgi:hypothetical protein
MNKTSRIIKILSGGMSMAMLISFSLPMLAQNLPSNLPDDRDRLNDDFFGDNDTNASERFFEQGEYQLEQEVIELEQERSSSSEDEEILEVDPEVTDDSQEIQLYEPE